MDDVTTLIAELGADYEFLRRCNELAATLVAENASPSSDDGLDYFYAACQSAAALSAFLISEDLDGFTAWLSEPVDRWLACDGDVRHNLANVLNAPEAAVWEAHINASFDL